MHTCIQTDTLNTGTPARTFPPWYFVLLTRFAHACKRLLYCCRCLPPFCIAWWNQQQWRAQKKQSNADEKIIAALKEIQGVLAMHTPTGLTDCQEFGPSSVLLPLRGNASSFCLQAMLHKSKLSDLLATVS